MKKTFFTVIVFVAILALAFFLIKISGQNILKDLTGQNVKKEVDICCNLNDKLLNKKVPFFDLANLSDKRIKLSDFTDKPFVIVFWATWNVESANQLKILDEYITSLKKENNFVSIISINSQEELSLVKSFIKRGGYDVPVALDSNGSLTEDFNIKSLPTAFFVDRDGIVREIYSGVLSLITFNLLILKDKAVISNTLHYLCQYKS